MATKQLKLSDFYSKKDHGHGNIDKNGAIGSTPNLPVITGASGKLQASSFGTAANTFCQGNDSRLSDSRVPVFNSVGASESAEKDLNTFKTGGFYYISSDAQSKYVNNCPLSKTDNISFFLLVETWGASSANYVKQTLTYYHNNKTYTRTCSNATWGPWDELKKTFDFTGMKGTDATVGYVKPLKFTIGKGFQDKPIEIEIYQRNRNEKCTVQIAFNNVNTNDPGINKLSHTGHNINIYLYKEGTGIWSLITSKGHAEKYGEMSVKISNPNPGINITRQDIHLESLPTSNLITSTYIGFTQDEKTKLAGIATGANKTTIANNLTTTTAGSALDATQGKELKTLVDGKAPTSHASTGTGYGVSTTANYGHTKIVQNLTTDDGNGLALGAGQGKTLKGLVDGKAALVHTHTKSQITDFPTSMVPTFTHINPSSSAHAKLDEYKTGGFYYCNSDNASPYIENQPLTTGMKAFFLLVETWGTTSTNYVKQTLTYHNTNKTYTRTCAGGTWLSWVELSKDTVYTHPNSGVTAGTNYNGNQTPSFGGTFNIPKLTFNAQGHITASANSTVTVPSLPTSSTSAAGIVKLNNNVDSTSTTEAATPYAVNVAYNKGNHSHPYAASKHVHRWKILKTYDQNNKVIIVRVNEKLKLAHVYVSYTTTKNYSDPPYMIEIATGSWFPIAAFSTEFGATSHNAVLVYSYTTGILTLKLIGAIKSGITIAGTMVFPYDTYDGEPAESA